MKSIAAAVAFACLSVAALPALAGDPTPVPSDKFPGWSTMKRETGTVFFYCAAPTICGKGPVVSFHFHELSASTKAEIREKQNEPRLPIACQDTGKYDTCEYPNAVANGAAAPLATVAGSRVSRRFFP